MSRQEECEIVTRACGRSVACFILYWYSGANTIDALVILRRLLLLEGDGIVYLREAPPKTGRWRSNVTGQRGRGREGERGWERDGTGTAGRPPLLCR